MHIASTSATQCKYVITYTCIIIFVLYRRNKPVIDRVYRRDGEAELETDRLNEVILDIPQKF